jgi:hypothetical protein
VLRRSRTALVVLVVTALAAALVVVGAAKSSHALNGKVLIIDTAFAAGVDYNEADAAASLGLGADVVTAEQWAAMTTADFAQYDAIVLPDDNCGGGSSATALAAPLANLSTWVPAVTGNIFITTSDVTLHANNGSPGAVTQMNEGIGFAAAQGITGVYFTSSCYDDDAWLGILNAFSPGWSADMSSSDSIHVTGSAAELPGLVDASLSNYGTSVHHMFDSWASDFTVFAIATNEEKGGSLNVQGDPSAAATVTGPYEAQDGTVGAPVNLLRGAAISPSHILLQPDTQTHDVGTPGHLTATVTDPDPPEIEPLVVEGVTVTFTVVSGPHAGTTVQGVTDADGNVTIEITSTVGGTDVWEASFVDANELTQTSNQVEAVWTAAAPAAIIVTPRFTG